MFQIHPDLTHANACKCFIEGATPLMNKPTSVNFQNMANPAQQKKNIGKKPTLAPPTLSCYDDVELPLANGCPGRHKTSHGLRERISSLT